SLHEKVLAVPVFNLEPSPGEPARFGFFAAHALVFINTAVNSEEEYAATVKVRNATQAAEVLGSLVTLWGNPGSPVHDSARGWLCVEGEAHAQEGEKKCNPDGLPNPRPERAFLLLPT